jgi:hypothetical protein
MLLLPEYITFPVFPAIIRRLHLKFPILAFKKIQSDFNIFTRQQIVRKLYLKSFQTKGLLWEGSVRRLDHKN